MSQIEDITAVRCPMCLGAGAVGVNMAAAVDGDRWVSRAARKLLKIREKLGIAPVALVRKPPEQKIGDALWKGKQKEDPPIMTEEGDVVVQPDGKTPYRSKYR